MSNVTKKDLVDQIALRTGLTQVDTKLVVECFLDEIARSLLAGKNIEIRGFGRFKMRKINPRLARNPKTGDPVMVKEGVKPIFEVSRELKKYINTQLETAEGKPEA